MKSLTFFLVTMMMIFPQYAKAEVKTVILAGGCFWCLQHDMNQIKGVLETKAGYSGGDRPNPTYQDYHTLDDLYKVGHIEVVEVKYDNQLISFEKIISSFLRKIDPTDGEGQFCDRGEAYRPAIFYASSTEKGQAEMQIAQGQNEVGTNFNIDLIPATQFWAAEEYHQNYAEKSPIKYKFYRYSCGRDARVNEIWSKK